MGGQIIGFASMINLTNIPNFLLVAIVFGYMIIAIRFISGLDFIKGAISLCAMIFIPLVLIGFTHCPYYPLLTNSVYTLMSLLIWLWIAELEANRLRKMGEGCPLNNY